MYLGSTDSLLESIDSNIDNLSNEGLDSLLKNIDAFQQDPSILLRRNKLPGYIKSLTHDLFTLEYELQLLRCKVFYNLSKVVTWKKIVVYLPTNVFLITRLLEILQTEAKSWYTPYFLLSWVYILTLSPFKFDEVHDRIYKVAGKYTKLQTVQPIVAQIHAQLLLKNTEAFKPHDLDLLTLNYFLKGIKPDSPVIDESMLHHFNSMCFQRDDIITLKILPKLFKINAFHDEWEAVEDIISYFLSHLDDSFTNYRFALAHSFSKVVNTLINDFDDLDTATGLVESCIDRIKHCLYETPTSLIDHDFLHTNLLIIAELCHAIAQNMPQLLNTVAMELIPPALKFQQLKMNEIKGSQIKDASNFICWSLARSTRSPEVKLSEDVEVSVLLNLLVCSSFDRDLLVRRSANAAMQELLGRCFAATNVFENDAIMKIIELPILNLAENYVDNADEIYTLFTKNESHKPYALFVLNWLIDINLAANCDLYIVRLTIEALLRLAQKFPNTISHIKIKLDRLINQKDTLIAARSLDLILTMELEELFSSQNISTSNEIHTVMDIMLESVKIHHRAHGNDINEFFKFFVILKGWVFSLRKLQNFSFTGRQIEICFHIVRMTSDSPYYKSEFKNLFNEFVYSLSREPHLFATSEDEVSFWTIFEKFTRLNNSLTSSALPELPPAKFYDIFLKSLPIMDSQRKSRLLDSLIDHLPNIVNTTGNSILNIIVQLLNDYTITQQGDVGRLVRISASKIVARHKDIFWETKDQQLIDDVVSNLLRLSGEQVKEARIICFKTLCKVYGYSVEGGCEVSNSRLLDFQHQFFQGKSSAFWKGYMVTGGAINFSISEVTNAIDDFMIYYYSLPSDQDRLNICNCLMRIIPSAKEVTEHQNTIEKNVLGLTKPDLLKTTITFLNFWTRLMESGLMIDPHFNFNGVYAKIYNLNLIKGSSLLKLCTIQMLPHLLSSQVYSLNEIDRAFANKVIRRLLVLAQREAQQKVQMSGSESSLVQKALIEALAQIYAEHGYLKQLEILKNATANDNAIIALSESQLIL